MADALLIAENLDGLILLVSLDKVDRKIPQSTVKRINMGSKILLGVITNSITDDDKNLGNQNSYNYYSYNYNSYASYANVDDDTDLAEADKLKVVDNSLKGFY